MSCVQLLSPGSHFAFGSSPRAGVEYVSLDELLKESDIVSLHCPLMPATRHIIGAWQ